MAVKNAIPPEIFDYRRCYFMNILKFTLQQFEFRKTFERLSVGNLAVFGDFKD